jgi:hypothetical protein
VVSMLDPCEQTRNQQLFERESGSRKGGAIISLFDRRRPAAAALCFAHR